MAQIAIRLSEQEKEKLAASAAANDLTISQILRSLIRKYLGGLDDGWRTGIWKRLAIDPAEGKRYMHQYNFPPYCTGEVGRMGAPKRREIGHGALAEKALLPVLPTEDDE